VERERLTLSKVSEGPFLEYIPVTAEVIPQNTYSLTAEEGGIVEKVFIRAGTQVRKGEPILQLSNTTLLLDIMYREAELFQQMNNLRNTRLLLEQNQLSLRMQVSEARNTLERAKRKFERSKILNDEQLISRQDFEEAESEYNLALEREHITSQSQETDQIFRKQQIQQLEESANRMRDNLEIAKQKLENLVIKAPISGVLTALQAEIGQSKARGVDIGQIDAQEGFKVRASIDQFYLDRVRAGKKGQFEFSGKNYELIVDRVYMEVRDSKFEADLNFTGKEPQGIRRGQTLSVRLELGELSQALLVARGGFWQKTGGNWIFVLQPDGKTALKRFIRLGRQNPDVYEVLDGLKPGETVITSSYDAFGDNERLVLD
jgi:HlyD family secretion protein